MTQITLILEGILLFILFIFFIFYILFFIYLLKDLVFSCRRCGKEAPSHLSSLFIWLLVDVIVICRWGAAVCQLLGSPGIILLGVTSQMIFTFPNESVHIYRAVLSFVNHIFLLFLISLFKKKKIQSVYKHQVGEPHVKNQELLLPPGIWSGQRVSRLTQHLHHPEITSQSRSTFILEMHFWFSWAKWLWYVLYAGEIFFLHKIDLMVWCLCCWVLLCDQEDHILWLYEASHRPCRLRLLQPNRWAQCFSVANTSHAFNFH